MKILGVIKNNRDSMDAHLNMEGGRVTQILTELAPLTKHMSLKNRKEVIQSKAMSLLLYGAEFIPSQNEWTKGRFSVLMMRCNRSIYRKDWFKVSNRRICKDIGTDTPDQIVKKLTLRHFHKIIWNRTPLQIYRRIRFNNNHRNCSKISLSYPPSKNVIKRTAIESGLELYNNLSVGLKSMHPRKLKEVLKTKSV